MKISTKILLLLLALCLTVGTFVGCQNNDGSNNNNNNNNNNNDQPDFEAVDYVAGLELDMNTDSLKHEVKPSEIKSYIDGDTTHFYVPTSVSASGILKARYLAINTPESTGKIEPWGKKASAFTKEKLMSATSIIIESDDTNWNLDSTGDRHLVWVWYKTADSESYRNLNLEILQNGLALASSSAENRYGDTCMNAINQAKKQKLNVWSGKSDPDFFYGDALPVTIKHLSSNIALYDNMKVAFEGVVARNHDQTLYVEQYDPETDMYFGVTCYYGWNLIGTGLDIVKEGNLIKVVGSVQYYTEGETWQISDLKYVEMRPNDANNVQLISTGHSAANILTTADTLKNAKTDIEVFESLDDDTAEKKTVDYAQAALWTSIKMEGLKITRITTTTSETSSKGAMTFFCEVGGKQITVRTAVLFDENNNKITANAYQGKTINVTGVLAAFKGEYQIKVFTPADIEIVK